jgi:hypothetical protein
MTCPNCYESTKGYKLCSKCKSMTFFERLYYGIKERSKQTGEIK